MLASIFYTGLPSPPDDDFIYPEPTLFNSDPLDQQCKQQELGKPS